jgi:hypothetical protein
MKFIKIIRIVLLVLIIIGLGLLATQKFWVPKLVDKIISLDKKSDVVVPISQIVNNETMQVQPSSGSNTNTPNILPLDLSTKIHVSIPSELNLLLGTSTAPGIPPFKNGEKVEIIGNEKESGTAMFGDAYFNGKEIAKGVPLYSTLEGTSPDSTYYAYRSLSHASAGSSFIGIQVFNLHTGEYTSIDIPPGEKDSNYIDSRSGSWYEVLPYIESYAWENNHSINFVFYYVAWGAEERVSPREIWNYDLNTTQYTLISSE